MVGLPRNYMAELFQQLKAALAERYQLEIELGSGGMATVYLAVDLLHQRRVAVKVLHPRWAGAVGQERFLQEIRFAAELSHPHILPLLDSGTVTIDGRSLPYYAMPFVEGETLRGRLARQRQLPIDQALAIARDVAAALSYAHAHDVVHRDIKPENILLAGSEAMVADFGIARAINRSADATVITTYNMAVGTPQYMSPEQSLAAQEIDGRSDLYSLGCVLYEMLGGEPPFTGATPQAIVARHQLDPVPSLTTIRPGVPPGLELVVRKALQKQAADRFQSADEMSRALAAVGTGQIPTVETRNTGGRRFRIAFTVLALAVAGTLAAKLIDGHDDPADQVLDTTLFAVIPTTAPTGAEEVDPSLLLQDALAGWRGVNLVDPFQVRAAIARREGGSEWGAVARELKAGRYVRVDATRLAGFVRINAVLYDTRENLQLANQVERVAPDYANADSVFALLAERLLFREDMPKTQRLPVVGTRIMPARQAFQRGYRALEDWQLQTADSSFDAATRYDPDFGQAFLWLALVRMWNGDDQSQWRSAIERAKARRMSLSSRDHRIAEAVLAQSQGAIESACRVWSRLTEQDEYSFVAWYGRGDCLRRDDVVIPDSRSPTGWRYRSSYHSAVESLRRAFTLLPSIHKAFTSFTWLTSATNLRGGRGARGDTTTFLAAPSWIGDSLVFFPVPAWEAAQGRETTTATTIEAIRRQRQIFHHVAAGWVSEYPQSSQAMEALAIAMEMLGDRAALDTLHRAKDLTADRAERLRIATTEVWMRVRFSFPADRDGLEIARRLADSLLAANPPGATSQPRALASLAALTGKGHLAAHYVRDPLVREAWGVPPALGMIAPPFIIYAAMGGPRDSLIVLERSITRIIDQELDPASRPGARLQWLALGATVAFPSQPLPAIRSLQGKGDYLINAEAALLSGDTALVVRVLENVRRDRHSITPTDLSYDALYPEAYLLKSIGKPVDAIAWIDPTLTSLASAPHTQTNDAFQAGALVRLAILRASLADQIGDDTASRTWASAAVILWAGADDYLQTDVRAMQALRR